MKEELVFAWRNHLTGVWTPVGKLSYWQREYIFEYTELAKKSIKNRDFLPLHGMENTDIVYKSKSLFPIFQNRLLEKSRPEFSNFYKWLNLSEKTASPINELEKSGGTRATDNFHFFKIPKKSLDKYTILFFARGIRHMADSYQARIQKLDLKSKLFIVKDVQNASDPLALIIRTEDPPELVGYIPRVYAKDVNFLLNENGTKNVTLEVEKVNYDAPSQYKLLCSLTTRWPQNFRPFEDLEKQF